MEDAVLTNRELSSLIWLMLLVVFGVWKAGPSVLGRNLASIAQAAAAPAIWLTMLLYLGWIASTVAVGAWVGVWTSGLLKGTILWAVLAGLGLLFSLNEAMKEDGHFRKAFVATLGASAIVEYVVSFQSFHLVIELLLQPVVLVLTLVAAMAASRETAKLLVGPVQAMLGVIGLIAIAWVLWNLGTRSSEVDLGDVALDFLLPVWLTASALAFVWLLAVYASYEMIYKRMALRRSENGYLKQLLAVGLTAGPRLGVLRHLTKGSSAMRLRDAESFGEARQEIGVIRTAVAEREAEEQAAAQRLIDNAGVVGVDDEGRQIDEREFAETRSALRWLSNCHMGHYRNHGRYREDLLALVESHFERDGLPEDHGVEMHVSSDGQSWYAARQTVSGWWFGIGGVGGPPNEQLYDGAQPPSGFPSESEWDNFVADDHSANWD